jgi:hypothetical protein
MTSDCFLCRRSFRYGPDLYEGRPILAWRKIMICRRCDHNDGVVIEEFPHLVAHLKGIGVPITLNAKGWLDIPPRGS